MMRCKFVWCVLVAISMAGSICYANMYNDRAKNNKYNDQMQKNAIEQIPAGPNPSTLPYEKRAQRLPDQGLYNGRGVYNLDSWPAHEAYIGQDGTILYCDKKGNVYDSNGVRYGKRESDGQLRKLNEVEQLYDAAFNPNYADKAFKAEERKFEKMSRSNPKSSFEDEVKQSDITSQISKNQEMPRPLRRTEEKWTVEPMNTKSAIETLKEEQEKAEKDYLKDKLFPDLAKEFDVKEIKAKVEEFVAMYNWEFFRAECEKRSALLDEMITYAEKWLVRRQPLTEEEKKRCGKIKEEYLTLLVKFAEETAKIRDAEYSYLNKLKGDKWEFLNQYLHLEVRKAATPSYLRARREAEEKMEKLRMSDYALVREITRPTGVDAKVYSKQTFAVPFLFFKDSWSEAQRQPVASRL